MGHCDDHAIALKELYLLQPSDCSDVYLCFLYQLRLHDVLLNWNSLSKVMLLGQKSWPQKINPNPNPNPQRNVIAPGAKMLSRSCDLGPLFSLQKPCLL